MMQRSSSGMLAISMPANSGLGRTRSSQLVAQAELEDDASFKDLEKGEKMQWRLKAEQAVHLIPVILMTCMLVLYIFSTVPTLDAQVKADTQTLIAEMVENEKPVLPERHLHQAQGGQAGTVSKTLSVSNHLQDLPARKAGYRGS